MTSTPVSDKQKNEYVAGMYTSMVEQHKKREANGTPHPIAGIALGTLLTSAKEAIVSSIKTKSKTGTKGAVKKKYAKAPTKGKK